METSVTSLPESAQERQILGPDESPVKFVSATFFARQGFIDANRPALQKFMAAIGMADDWIRAHHDDAMAACKDTGSTPATCASSLATLIASKNPYTFSSTGRVNVDGIQGMIPALSVQFPEMKNKTVNDFVDASIAAGAN
jgi:ABC-type nitrate/sulfonate/bicarbonate transport system substrate-binding protein